MTRTGSGIDSSPAVANGVVYVSSSNNYLGLNGALYALNANTGAKLWSSTAANGTPTVVNGTLYIGGTAFSLGADLFLRIRPTPETVTEGCTRISAGWGCTGLPQHGPAGRRRFRRVEPGN